MNMKQWLEDLKNAPCKKALPVLSFPCIRLMGISVRELIADSDLQAKGMKLVADRVDAAASVSMMDLSVEAGAFGARIQVSDDEVPTVVGALVTDEEAAQALAVPAVGAGRTGKYVQAIEKACKLITDRPVFAGIIGPFSLAGLLSPDMAQEFSEPYVRQIVEAVQDDNFLVIYHNCGDNTVRMIDSILRTGSAAYHFGNSISMKEMLEKVPQDIVVMGNVDPAAQLRNGTPESVRAETLSILRECGSHSNFVISSGCDIPPASPWENIDAFFAAVEEYYHPAQ